MLCAYVRVSVQGQTRIKWEFWHIKRTKTVHLKIITQPLVEIHMENIYDWIAGTIFYKIIPVLCLTKGFVRVCVSENIYMSAIFNKNRLYFYDKNVFFFTMVFIHV